MRNSMLTAFKIKSIQNVIYFRIDMFYEYMFILAYGLFRKRLQIHI